MTVEMRSRDASEKISWTPLKPGDYIQNVFTRHTDGLLLVEAEAVMVDSPISIRHNRITKIVSVELVENPGRVVGEELRSEAVEYMAEFINDHPEIGTMMGQSFRFRLSDIESEK